MAASKKTIIKADEGDYRELIPDVARNMIANFKSLRDIDQIDRYIYSLTPQELTELVEKLDVDKFDQFMGEYVKKNPNSPIRLTPLLRLNGKPFTLSRHRMFEPLFYNQIPSRSLLVCGRQLGKMLSVDTPIPTPDGTTTMGALKVGDKVLGADGKPTSVVWTSEVDPAPRSYRVSFSDGTHVDACADHQWFVFLREHEDGCVRTTAELLKDVAAGPVELPAVRPVILSERELPEAPFKLGSVVSSLTEIPAMYLRSSIAQRTALLMGILSSVPYVYVHGQYAVSMPTDVLAGNLVDLLCGLGHVAYRTAAQTSTVLFLDSSADQPARRGRKKINRVEAISPTPMRCIQVDNADKLYLCGQGWVPTHNSTALAAQGVIQAAANPMLKLLYMAPLFEQIRRFSHQYIRPFVHESTITESLTGPHTVNSVLHKSFANGSELWFSFAMLDVDRVRGLAVDGIRIDEIQDMDPEFLDIIRECTSASENRSEMYAGTSKTVDNLIEQLRQQSSQAEWFMKCAACGHWNIPTVEGSGAGLTVFEMIGPDGLCCCRCKSLLDPERGQWVHRFTDRVEFFPSYHIPQVVSPIHYANKKNWFQLLHKRDHSHKATFINEVLGEACDEGQRLVSKVELESVCVLPPNDRDTSLKAAAGYPDKVLGIDWGGKGAKQTSLTAAAVACAGLDNKVYIMYGELWPAMMDPTNETTDMARLARDAGVSVVAHDVGGAGEIRLSMLRGLGIPDASLANFRYQGSPGSVKSIITHVPAGEHVPNSYFNVDKDKAIAAVCLGIKSKSILFPKYSSMRSGSGDNMMDHFLAVYEEMQETKYSGMRRYIAKNISLSDDFMHATIFAVLTLWCRYPDLVPNLGIELFSQVPAVNPYMHTPRRYLQDM